MFWILCTKEYFVELVPFVFPGWCAVPYPAAEHDKELAGLHWGGTRLNFGHGTVHHDQGFPHSSYMIAGTVFCIRSQSLAFALARTSEVWQWCGWVVGTPALCSGWPCSNLGPEAE